jgi:hypothetical protein
MKPQLLCTFTYIDQLPICIGSIHKIYNNDVANLNCYSYIDTPRCIVCIYNVFTNEKRLKDTISINRKKDTNTFYSINALNSLIKVLNNGILDKTFKVEWANYMNSLLLSDGFDSYKIIKIKELTV